MPAAMKYSLLFLLLPLPALADVYIWKEGDRTQMSAKPPPWYRADERVDGPRVTVMKGRRVMDDTDLPMQERWRLRPPEHPPIPAGRRPL
jgi:hypothetical protein